MSESVYVREFEPVSKTKLINAEGVTYSDFKKGLTPNFLKVWVDIALGYIALTCIGAALFFLQNQLNVYWLIPVALMSAVLIGYFIAYIQLFFHEASHYNIARSKELNDILANLFIGVFVGADIKSYRVTHWDHHKYLGTTHDTEHSYFDPLNIRFIVESLVGIRVIKVLWHRQRHTSEKVENKHTTFGPMLFAGFFFHIVIMALALLSGFWIFCVCWLVGLVVFFPFFASVRQVLEHRDTASDSSMNFYRHDHGAHNRIFGEDAFSNTFGGAGFNRHLLHHWEPQISYTRLGDLEKFLLQTPLKNAILESKTSYFKVFFKLVKQR